MAIYCYTCQKPTRTIEPVMVRRLKESFHVYGLCAVCKDTKTGPLRTPLPMMPAELKNLKIHWNYLQYYDCGSEKKNLFEILNPLINY